MSDTDKSLNVRDALYESYAEKAGLKKKDNNPIKDVNNLHIEMFSTGSKLLDLELFGGYPKGKIVELFGNPGTGKTTLSIEAVAQHQLKYPNEPVLWLDLEGVFDKVYFQNIGIDITPEKFILAQPLTGEEAFEILRVFIDNNVGGIIVVDSVALLLPKKEAEADMEDAQMGMHARLMSRGLRNVLTPAQEKGITQIYINQIRTNIGGYGDTDKGTGGNSLPHYARIRVKTTRQNSKATAGTSIGNTFKLVKANFSKENTEVKTNILFGAGIDYIGEIMEIGKKLNVFEMSGSWFSYKGTKIGNGSDNVRVVLEDNWELLDEIEEDIFLAMEEYWKVEKEKREKTGGLKNRRRLKNGN